MLNKLSLPEQYVVLAFAVDQLLEDQSIIFNYFGPKELPQQAKAIKHFSIADIITQLKQLEKNLTAIEDEAPLFRRTYLRSQIRSLRGLLEYRHQKPTGTVLIKAIKNILEIDIIPPYDVDQEKQFLQTMLNQYGYDSYQSFQKTQTLLAKEPATINTIKSWIKKLKTFTQSDILPNIYHGNELQDFFEQSNIKIEHPRKGYPPCYYIYHGQGQATACFSKDHRKNELTMIASLLHELYPGHHLYYLYREKLFQLGILGVEYTLDLLYSSETALNEGIAETAPTYLVSLPEEIKPLIKIALAREHFCKKLLYNVWYWHFVTESMSQQEASNWLVVHGDFEPEKARYWLDFLGDWRIYYPSYPIGTDLTQQAKLFFLYLPKSISVLKKIKGT